MRQNEIVRLARAERDRRNRDIPARYDQQHQRDRKQQGLRAEVERNVRDKP